MFRLTQRSWLRFAAVFCALVAFVLIPLAAAGAINVRASNGEPTDLEGDPIDSNDYGSGAGGNHDDIEDSYAVAVVPPVHPGVTVGKWMILLVPDRSFGVPVFSFVVIERGAIVGEARYAQ